MKMYSKFNNNNNIDKKKLTNNTRDYLIKR